VGEQSLRRTIFASAAGMMIGWYDFYIFGSLATLIASKFYHTGTPLGDLIAWLATFAIGFVARPFGVVYVCNFQGRSSGPRWVLGALMPGSSGTYAPLPCY
jgi:hypothetical protein